MTATDDAIALLRVYDTPTICNGLEVISSEHRLGNYTRHPLVAAPAFYEAPEGARAICARAKTVRIRSTQPHGLEGSEYGARRADYYDYIADAGGPVIVAVEDTDKVPLGAFWGEVHTALHRALGALGAVTNGVIRDLDDLDPEFLLLGGHVGPSHAHVHVTAWGEGATVFGMEVSDGDIVHADRHGAVIVPEDAVAALPDAIAQIQEKEKRILDLTRDGRIDTATLRKVLAP